MSRRIRFVFLFNLLVLVLLLPGCDQSSEGGNSAFGYMQRAEKFRDDGQLRAAAIELKTAVSRYPENSGLRLLLGSVYNAAGDHKSAEKELARAAGLGAPTDQYLPELALALNALGESERLLREIKPTPDLQPAALALVHLARARAQIRLGAHDQAEASLQQAEKIDAENPQIAVHRAKLSYALGDRQTALKFVESALVRDAGLQEAWLIKAALLVADQRTTDAAAAYQRLLALNPNNLVALLDLAKLRLEGRDISGAEELVLKAEALAEGMPAVGYARALLEYERREFVAAESAAASVLQQSPDHLAALHLHGAAAFRNGSLEIAFSDLSRVVAQVPGARQARRLLAVTQDRLGNPDQALETLAPLLKIQPPDVGALGLAGDIYLSKGQYDKALPLFERASALAPEADSVERRVNLNRLAVGDSEAVIAALSSLDDGSEKPYEALLLTLAHLQKDDHEKALAALDSVSTEVKTASPILGYLRAEALLGLGDRRGARRALEEVQRAAPAFLRGAARLAALDLGDNQPDEARRRFETVLKSDDHSAGAMIGLANVAALEGQEAEFVAWLEKALSVDPSAMRPYQLLTRHYMGKRDPQAARQVADRALKRHPASPTALELVGVTQLASGDKRRAVRTLQRLVTMSPQAATPHYLLGLAYQASNELKKAKRSFRRAQAIAPDYVPTKENLMLLELASGQVDEALEIAQTMQRDDPESARGYRREGDVHFASRDFAAAAAAYAKAAAIQSDSELVLRQYQVDKLAGNTAALDHLRDWLLQHPKDAKVRRRLAAAHTKEGRYDAAITQYQELLTHTPTDVLALNNLAWLYKQTDDARAKEVAKAAYELAPDNTAVLDSYASILLGEGQAEKAKELLARAVAQTKNPSTNYRYAVALAESGDRSAAKLVLRRILESSQEFPERAEAETMLAGL